ncbi:MAG: UDP-N-acetylmuramate dehydrogenase [Alistipes sp.]|nr:UDP-N-acetylmuramate dehydrogenase [Alistipes sp.]
MIRVFENSDLSARNSFKVHQQAAKIVEFDSNSDLQQIFAEHVTDHWMVMGGANNILFTRDIDFPIIIPRNEQIEILSEGNEGVYVRVGAGLEWDELVAWSVERGLWGLENLSLIPGKVGAAPVQNIGAYGAEAKDTIASVEMFFPEQGAFVTLAAEHCGFGYRESVFKHTLKGRVIITSVTFCLSKVAAPKLGYGDVEREVEARGGVSLTNIREAICAIRRAKLPDTAVTGNAGSFFKNPIVEASVAQNLLKQYPDMPYYPTTDTTKVKLAAGWLIDQCGLKGYSEGNVGVHSRQALVLINTTGNATGSEVIAFAGKVCQTVAQKFGITIEPEVNIL